jgi:hypothetical protein
MKRKAETAGLRENIVGTVVGLINNPKVHDVVFLVGEGKQPMYALKHILAKDSPVFEAMFKGAFCEALGTCSSPAEIPIPDTTPEVFLEILHFLYTGAPKDYGSLDYASEIGLWRLADKYDIEKLRSICDSGISTRMSSENLFDVVPWLHILPDHLKEKAGSVAREVFDDMWDREEILENCEEQVIDNLVDVMKEDDLAQQLLCRWAYVRDVKLDRLREKLDRLDISQISKITMLEFKTVARKKPQMIIDRWEKYLRASSISPISTTWEDFEQENQVLAVLRKKITLKSTTSRYESPRSAGFFWDGRRVSWSFHIVREGVSFSLYLGHRCSDRSKEPLYLEGLGIGLYPEGKICFFGKEAFKTSKKNWGWTKYMTEDELEKYLKTHNNMATFYIVKK